MTCYALFLPSPLPLLSPLLDKSQTSGQALDLKKNPSTRLRNPGRARRKCNDISSGVFSYALTVTREESNGKKCPPGEEGLEVSLEKSQVEARGERMAFREQGTPGAAQIGRPSGHSVRGWEDRGKGSHRLGQERQDLAGTAGDFLIHSKEFELHPVDSERE